MNIPERQAKILVIDDEEQIRRALKSILSARHYEVLLATNGADGLDAAIDNAPDMIVLDLSMPDMSGMDVCRELRTWYAGPILVLSVRSGDSDKISALDLGADDYLTKPFSAGELLARVRALLRRTAGKAVPPPVIRVGEIEIDIPHRKVAKNGKEVDLTKTEFEVLSYLAKNADCVVTSKMILSNVWGEEYGEDTQTLRVHISHLRKKIEPHPSIPQYILTEPGVGFRLSTS